MKIADAGELTSSLPEGFKPVAVGIGAYTAVIRRESDGKTFVAKAFTVDGYDFYRS